MVTYGPWEQGPDYQQLIPVAYYLTQGYNGVATRTRVLLPGTAIADLMATEAIGGLAPFAGSAVGGHFRVTPTSRYSETFGGPTYGDFRGEASRYDGYWTAAERNGPAYFPDPPLPEGAVGVEYESDEAAAVGAALWFRLTSTATDSTVWPPVPAGVAAVCFLADRGPAANPPLEFAAGIGTYETDGLAGRPASVDLTPWMIGDPDGTILFASGVQKNSELVAANPSWDNGNVFEAEAIDVRGDWQTSVTYTLRPPRHRFIYEQAPVLPPTRVFPRDDGRLTSSARRIHPPPKSRQGSARPGPGSYP